MAFRAQIGRLEAFRGVHPAVDPRVVAARDSEKRAADAHARVVEACNRAWGQIHGLLEMPEQMAVVETRRALDVMFTSLQELQREADEQMVALKRALDTFGI